MPGAVGEGHYLESHLPEVNALFQELSPSSKHLITLRDVGEILASGVVVIATENGGKRLVGYGLLVPVRKFAGRYAQIEDVIVASSHRGRGIGELICRELIAIARQWEAKYVDLTSNPTRLAARQLYERLGFKQRETGNYRLTLLG